MTDKPMLRSVVKAARAHLSDEAVLAARAAVCQHVMAFVEAGNVSSGARIACYEPIRHEPVSNELLEALVGHGFEVIVPITLADNDLDWALWKSSRVGPNTPLGVDAVATAELVLVPALAVDRAGRRLGRGGGSYDRTLGRVSPSVVVAAIVYDREVVDEVPVEPWDRPVSAVVTPSGWSVIGLGNG